MKRALRAEHVAWQKYKVWQAEAKEEGKLLDGAEINSLREFQEVYNQAGRSMSRIKQDAQFQMSEKTYRSVKASYEEATGEKLGREARRTMTTRDIAEALSDDIRKYREQQFQAGRSKKEVARDVAKYFFGSE